MKIAIITDSSYDGKFGEIKDLYIVPLMISSADGKTQYKDDSTLSHDKFYEMLDREALKTSQSLPSDMLGMWDQLLTEYDQIIVALLSKGLSGQYSTYKMMSETEEQYKGKVFVVDTNGVSIVLQREIEKIASLIAEKKTGPEIMTFFENYSKDFFGFIIPKSLETLRRGGRITPAAAALGKLLKIVPVLSYDGMIDKGYTARTFKKAVSESLDLIKKHYKNNVKVIDLAYSRCEPENLELVERLVEKAGLTIGLKAELPNVISAHTGRNTFALVAWKE